MKIKGFSYHYKLIGITISFSIKGFVDDGVYSYCFEEGFVERGTLNTPREGHVAMLIPNNYASCEHEKHYHEWVKDPEEEEEEDEDEGREFGLEVVNKYHYDKYDHYH